MPSDSTPAPAWPAVSQLDHRVEASTGLRIDALWARRDRGALDEPHSHLVDRHRELVRAETSVIFYRTQLSHLSSGEFPVDEALLVRLDRSTELLRDAVATRGEAAERVLAALEPIEAASLPRSKSRTAPLPPADHGALLAIDAGKATLRGYLQTGQMMVTTAAGIRLPFDQLQYLQSAGLVIRGTEMPGETGQPVALTEAGRSALDAARRRPPRVVPKTTVRTGSQPSSPARRR